MKQYILSLSLLFSIITFGQETFRIRPLPKDIELRQLQFKKPNIFIYQSKGFSNELNQFLNSNFKSQKGGFPLDLKINPKLNKEGYELDIKSKKISLSAGSERGLYYGLQSLKDYLNQSSNLNSIQETKISDAPDINYRGVVEGFYGTPWSQEDRLRQIEFYGQNKLNTYIYGPKDDPYHSSPNWRKPYPEKEANDIKQLVEQSKKHFVDFVWAIHPGKDIQWNEEDRKNILQKFSAMYDLGVRSFAVFFDDIDGEGTNPNKQAELLNFIDNEFVKKKKDVTPLIMCPTEYNKAWSNVEKGYLRTLGTQLNKGIHIMWTGDTVIGDVTKESVTWINNQIQRKAYFWWNFPVSDYVRDHMLMGRAYGLDYETKGLLSGLVSNPMEHAEASKPAIYSMSQFAWNTKNYNSHEAWKEGLKLLMPKNFDALYFFAQHNSDLGPNGHKYRREESIEFQPIAEKFLNDIKSKNTSEQINLVKQEYEKMVSTSNQLLESSENPHLMKEIKPWVIQFKNLGELGLANIQLYNEFQNNNVDGFMKAYEAVKTQEKKMFSHSESANQNPYQPGVVVGSLVMKPLTEDIFKTFTERFNQKYGKNLEVISQYIPHKLATNISLFKNQRILFKRNVVEISPKLEPMTLKSKEFLGIELEQQKEISRVTIDLNNKEWKNLSVKISDDGKNWTVLEGQSNDKNTQWNPKNNNIKTKFIIIENHSAEPQSIYLKKFAVNLK